MSKAYQGQSDSLSASSAREMLTRVLPGSDLSANFGGHPAMTFIVSGEGEHFQFKHGGGTVGYRCFMVMYPETGDGAVFMTNSDAGYGVGMEMLRAASSVYDWPDFRPVSLQRRKINPAVQKTFIGKYPFEAGWQVEVVEVGHADGIAVRFPNGDVYALTAIQGKHNYVHEETGVKVRFNVDQQVPQIHLYNQTAINTSAASSE